MTNVTCAIIENEGKTLIARRAQDQKLAGKWEFPGGKVENGESSAKTKGVRLGICQFFIWADGYC